MPLGGGLQRGGPTTGTGAERRGMPDGSVMSGPPQPAADGETEMGGSRQGRGGPSSED